MRATSHLRVLAATVAVAALGLTACFPQTPVSWNDTPVQGYSELTPQQLSGYVAHVYAEAGGKVGSGCGRHPYRATVPVSTLARLYVEEGDAQYVRGDIAFAQSIIETGWFSFPDCGQVRPSYNNFAGIGAHDGGNHPVARFWDAHAGVRAQIQRLHWYSNPGNASTLARPIIPQKGWANASEYNAWSPGFPRGSKPTWQSLTGSWASSTCYDTRVMRVYNDIRAHHDLAPFPVWQKPGC